MLDEADAAHRERIRRMSEFDQPAKLRGKKNNTSPGPRKQ
jgi:hypothetical protein